MPFNLAAMSMDRRIFKIGIGSSRTTKYDIETKLVAAFSNYLSSQPGDIIYLDISASINLSSALITEYAIDGNDLDPLARLYINIGSGVIIYGKGGDGGDGGSGITSPVNGSDGGDGGVAIRINCDTFVTGAGTIYVGKAGGGGGAGSPDPFTSGDYGGGGGGGGAAFGSGGTGGTGNGASRDGDDGIDALINTFGAGGIGGSGGAGGVGGDGGDSGNNATAGTDTTVGTAGAAGSDGAGAVETNGDTNRWNVRGSTTVVGSIL